jgi:hypothetical protein
MEENKTNERTAKEEPMSRQEELEFTETLRKDVEKKHKLFTFVKWANFCVMILLVGIAVLWLIHGDYGYAINNVLWAFIAWIMWRENRKDSRATKIILWLLNELDVYMTIDGNNEVIISHYEKMHKLNEEIKKNQEQMISILKIEIAGLKANK